MTEREEGNAMVEIYQSAAPTVLPGVTVALTNGTIVTVRPWGVRQLPEVAALVGAIIARIIPEADVGTVGRDPLWLVNALPDLLRAVPTEMLTLIRYSTRLPAEMFDEDPPPEGRGLTAEEGLALGEAIVRQNQAFFARLSRLMPTTAVQTYLAGLRGRTSPPPSSPPGSPSTISDG